MNQKSIDRDIRRIHENIGRMTSTLPENVDTLIDFWMFYLKGITQNAHSFLFGHPDQPDIKNIPSVHNYYLDFVYNFGFIAFIPNLIAVVYTSILILLHLRDIITPPSLFCLVFSLILLVFIENSLKAVMRQPYPGIVTFFLWGLLFYRLELLNATYKHIKR